MEAEGQFRLSFSTGKRTNFCSSDTYIYIYDILSELENVILEKKGCGFIYSELVYIHSQIINTKHLHYLRFLKHVLILKYIVYLGYQPPIFHILKPELQVTKYSSVTINCVN